MGAGEFDAQVIDARTGKEKAGYRKAQSTLACAKEAGGWKVVRELESFDDMAEAVVADPDEQERAAILESLGSLSDMAATLNRAGWLNAGRGKHELALSSLHRARELSEAAADGAQQRLALQRIGDVRQLMGQYDEALEAYQQSLALAEAMNVREDMAYLRVKLASVHTLLGRHDSALAEIEWGISVAKGINNTYWLAANLTVRGNSNAGVGRHDEAIKDYQQALALAENGQANGAMEKSQATRIMDVCLNNLGISYRIQGIIGVHSHTCKSA